MNNKWSPYVCMMTNSTCYKNTEPMKVKGVLWHDTGCDNPWLCRYVQPTDGSPNYAADIIKLGKNRNGNDWNHKYVQAGLNCWVGKFADGSVGTVQTMPWDWRPWGCGSGKKGSCNSGWIQFEICEDAKGNMEYAQQVWDEAIDLTAFLCVEYGIDPYGTTIYNGVTVPTILCHWDSYLLGLGSGHDDIYDWFPKILGKNMDDVRKEVAARMVDKKGWVKEGDTWYYYYEDGTKATGWLKLRGVWYYFNEDGAMQVGWVESKGKKYYLNPTSGGMVTGWLHYENKWYYMTPGSGAMYTGWLNESNKWYYLHEDGTMAQKEWAKYEKDNYYYWLSLNGQWKYKAKGGWYGKDKKRWFKDEKGWSPVNEIVIIDYSYCTFDENGYLTKVEPINPVDTDFKVKITTEVLNVRSGPGTGYGIVNHVEEGDVYTIVEVQDNWGRLKSGAGWICLDYTERVN